MKKKILQGLALLEHKKKKRRRVIEITHISFFYFFIYMTSYVEVTIRPQHTN